MTEATIEITPLRFGAFMITGNTIHVLPSEQPTPTRIELPNGFTQGHVVNALNALRGCTRVVIITDSDDPPRKFWNGQRYTTLNTEVIGTQLSTTFAHVSIAKAITVHLRNQCDESDPGEVGVVLINDTKKGDGGTARWYHTNRIRFKPVPVLYMGNTAPGPLQFLLPKPLSQAWLIAGGLIQAMVLRYLKITRIGVWFSSPFDQAHFGPDGSFWRYMQSEGYKPSITVVDNVDDLLRAGTWLAPRSHLSQFVT